MEVSGEHIDVTNEQQQEVFYLDPEGGYPDASIGRAAEVSAMTR